MRAVGSSAGWWLIGGSTRLELVVGADTPTLSAGGWTPHYKYSEKLQTVEQLGACRQLRLPIERNYHATKQST